MANMPSAAVVYIVDDDDSVRRGLSRLMRSAGLPSENFSSAEEFLAEVDEERTGCLLLDITLPRLTGHQLQAELKKRKIDLPVIVISARDDGDTRRMALELGARFFFRKPVDDQALLDTIHWLLTPVRRDPSPN